MAEATGAADIAERLGAQRRGIEPVLQALTRAGLLDSTRGPRGGYRLARAPRAIPLIEANYRVLPGQENRALAGLSMGGWQSLTIGLNAVDRFAWIGSFSGAADTEAVKGALAGSENTNAKLKLLWIACGREDFLLDRNNTLIDALKAAKVKHEWHLTEGDHSWPVWRQYLTEFAPRLFQH
jgi:enterochelin esterase family protein